MSPKLNWFVQEYKDSFIILQSAQTAQYGQEF